jgi:metal-responsive CopG/Arc/MetJ family transcriptional regulator
MTVMTFKVPDALARRIRAVAAQHHTSRSAVVREAVEEYVDHNLATSEDASVYDLIREFVGTIDGPHDLSIHPRHMRGYGQ